MKIFENIFWSTKFSFSSQEMSCISLIGRSQKAAFVRLCQELPAVALARPQKQAFWLYGLTAAFRAKTLTFVLLITFSLLFSQNNATIKGEKQFEKLAYFDLIKTYEKLVEKGIQQADIYEKLADAYYFNADYLKALNHYETLYQNYPKDLKKETLFRYALCLKSANKSKESENILKKMHELFPEDSRPSRMMTQTNDDLFKIKLLEINTIYSDFGGQAFGNQFIFASNKPQNKLFERKHSWTNEAFIKLYQGNLTSNQEITAIKPLKFEQSFPFNESSACLTKDGKTLYFTRNVKLKKQSEIVTNYLKIYRATLVNDTWSNIEDLSINLENYNTAHPTLSADEQTLYFASDRPGGFGDSDLYRVNINADGTFSEPENLGHAINTEGKETFPFISNDNLLYFASNGHQGFGGLDIFVANLSHNQKNIVQNLGSSINSAFDDFSFNINSTTKKGFFSSNRIEQNKGKDDIYSFKQINEIVWSNTSQKIFVFDQDTNQPIVSAKISLIGGDLILKTMNQTNASGQALLENFENITSQTLQITHPDYEGIEQVFNPALSQLNIFLKRKKNQLNTGDDLAKIFNIKNIFFDLDKWFIRADAAADLNKILTVLEDFPDINLFIRSHTDCRNTRAYNLNLSEKRAISTKNWLIEKGIDPARLKAKGFGEEELVNECACEPKNDSTCNEDQHQANRRSEFIVER